MVLEKTDFDDVSFSKFLRYGKIRQIIGLKIEVIGLNDIAEIGGRVLIQNQKNSFAEVISILAGSIIVMPYGDVFGLHEGLRVDYLGGSLKISPSPRWAGRVINGLGEPVDNLGPLPVGPKKYGIKNRPPAAYERTLVSQTVDLGIKSLNMFTTMCHGQRVGIFAGSGVGKTVLLSQLTRFSKVDFVVIGLVGERGREVNEFLNTILTEEMRKKTIVIVETSDAPALLRRSAAYITLTVAEALRDSGFNVLCMVDSLTRFAFAQREIGLAAGEIPTAKGFPPTVINELASLLERAGPGRKNEGTITGIFTVLVEGDDLLDPVPDTVRSILDGHIVLSRKLAEKNHYPAVDILKSLSRTVPKCQSQQHQAVFKKAKKFLAEYYSMEDMILLGAYKRGTNSDVDRAIKLYPALMDFLMQGIDEHVSIDESVDLLQKILEN